MPRLNLAVFKKSLKRWYRIPVNIASTKVAIIINVRNKKTIVPIEPLIKAEFEKRAEKFSIPPTAVIGPSIVRNPTKTKIRAIIPRTIPSIRKIRKKYNHIDQLRVCLKDSVIVSTKPVI